MNSRIQDARGQCYDGAAAMAGAKTGVATQIKAINGKCLYTHCYGHALNLAIAIHTSHHFEIHTSLARQSLSLRGDWKANEKCEADSNFYQLLKLRCDEDPTIIEWLKKKTSKFISADIQNEILQVNYILICFHRNHAKKVNE